MHRVTHNNRNITCFRHIEQSVSCAMCIIEDDRTSPQSPRLSVSETVRSYENMHIPRFMRHREKRTETFCSLGQNGAYNCSFKHTR